MRQTTIRLFYRCQYCRQHEQGIQKKNAESAHTFTNTQWKESLTLPPAIEIEHARCPTTTYAEVLHVIVGVEAKVANKTLM